MNAETGSHRARGGAGACPVAEDIEEPELRAYYTGPRPHVAIAPASRWREWMSATDGRWANRCLPLLMANEAGWCLLNPATFTARWSGGTATDSIQIAYDSDPSPASRLVHSHFGYGVLTWGIPYLFRTPSSHNLLVRGPANFPKDAATPLEGLVETAWSVATFTMNWKITRAETPVTFVAGEPFCQIVPQRRWELPRFKPTLRDLRSEPDLAADVRAWVDRRHDTQVEKFRLAMLRDGDREATWEGDYFRGLLPDGTPAADHQTKQRLRPFAERAER